jgi:hypothetical protein
VPERPSWNVADTLDFEALLHADEQRADPREVAERDARLWREHISPGLSTVEATDPARVFHRWLTARRETEPALLQPGSWLVSGWRSVGVLGVLAGLLLGFLASGAALYYAGARPVNVAVFLAVTVGVQWVLLATGFGLWLARGFRPAAGRFLVMVAEKLGRWFASALEHLSGEQRMKLRGQAAALRQLAGRNGGLLGWPPLLALQGFGVAWNCGVLAALLLRVLASDVAFGWESTWTERPEGMHAITRVIAAPWTWALPAASPTLEQVAQSRFYYQSGVAALERSATSAWWPWLVMVVLIYGLLPRLLLLLWANAKLRGALRRVSFDEPRHKVAWLRLVGPVVRGETSESDADGPHAGASVLRPPVAVQPGCLLVASVLRAQRGPIERWARANLGWEPLHTVSVEIDFPSGNGAALASLAEALPAAPRWLIAVPAPFTAFAAFAQFLQTLPSTPEQSAGHVVVVAQDAEGRPAAPDESWLRYWRDFLRSEPRELAVFAYTPE